MTGYRTRKHDYEYKVLYVHVYSRNVNTLCCSKTWGGGGGGGAGGGGGHRHALKFSNHAADREITKIKNQGSDARRRHQMESS